MKLSEQLTDYINAAFAGLWIVTHEPDEAQREIYHLAKDQDWKVVTWDIANGLSADQLSGDGSTDPLSALRALPALGDPNSTAILLLHNFHRFLNNPEVIQATFARLIAGKEQRTFLVVLSPSTDIPVELEKLFVVIEHSLPDREQLHRIAKEITSEQPEDLPDGADLDKVLDAAAGLTRYEAEGAFALSIARHSIIQPQAIWDLKAQALRKNNLMTLYQGKETFSQLGGLQSLKDFCSRALRSEKGVKPRGVLLLGLSGSGKSAFAKALGNETGRPTLMLDFGALLGSLVGQSEQNLRKALQIADAMSPCILFCDELEKALSGVGSQGDSGVSTRMFGSLLTWLSDHESDVFFIGTSNDISKLPPEFSRAERFDGVFFLDLPSSEEKEAIWQMYRAQYGIPDNQDRPDDTDFTGAEIRSCCRLAALLDVSLKEAAQNVVPVAITAAEQVEKLRQWASGRCLNASAPGVYRRTGERKSTRRIKPRPSDN